MPCRCRNINGMAEAGMRVFFRVVGWLVLVGGSLFSLGFFWIDHMNPQLWAAMAVSVAACVVVGSVLLRFGAKPISEESGRSSGTSPPDHGSP